MYTPLSNDNINQLKSMSVKFNTVRLDWCPEGYAYQAFFSNGYGISIVKHDGSYGRWQDQWEIAVLRGNSDKYDLCYDTPVTDDVIGYLEDAEVMDYARQIAELKGE